MAQALILAAILLPWMLACGASKRDAGAGPSQEARVITLTRSRAGATEWKIESPRAVFDENASKARLDTPRFALFKAGRPETAATAEHGEFNMSSQDMLLTGSVRVDNSADHVSLRTDELRFVSSSKEFRTERPVEIRRPEGVMRGRGLTASQDLSTIHVHHQETRVE